MKLKNKKTGEIGYFCFANWNDPVLIIMNKNGVQLAKYNSLAALNAEWEDVSEEQKRFYWLDYNGDIYNTEIGTMDRSEIKEIGNYFESKEEAELAVEKLKALKRLKDKGFRFDGWTIDDGLKISICTTFEGDNIYSESEKEIRTSLDLLFKGEE